MIKKILIFFNIFLSFLTSYSQIIIKGKVIDYFTKEPLVGVNIIADSITGTITNEHGIFTLKINEEVKFVEFRYLGYKTERLLINQHERSYENIIIRLQEESRVLNEVVISAGKFEQKKSDVSVSVEVVKSEIIEKNNFSGIESALQKAPGIVILEKQASIRGGSGYSYGAGSRVMLLFDDLPLLTGASSEAIWDLIPVECIGQIEIIKGATSALYGASALNGIVNLKTISNQNKPITTVRLSGGFYGSPLNEYQKWWKNRTRNFQNFQFYHSLNIHQFHFSLSGSFAQDEGYRQNDNYRKARIYSKIQKTFGKENELKVGSNLLFMMKEGGNFLLWKDGDTGIFMVSESFKQKFQVSRLIYDPYLIYNKNNTFHSIRSRFYYVRNTNNTFQNNTDYQLYNEYRYQKFAIKNLVISAGLTYAYFGANSEFYGDTIHTGHNAAVYGQIDKKVKKFSFSGGIRWEYYRIDTFKILPKWPVMRLGLNYKLLEYTNLRASFGQGFRYPSIAEKFTHTQVGSLNIFPNSELNSEKGWSAEVGLFQGYRLGKLKGYLDFAAFWTHYYNMMEFAFGLYNPPNVVLSWNPGSEGYIPKWIGFRAQNAENARITGFEAGIFSEGDFGRVKVSFNTGYTYLNPVTLNKDSAYLASFSDSASKILKYRMKHQLKGDLELIISHFNVGIGYIYLSPIVNIDKAFENLTVKINNTVLQLGDVMLPGIKEYRASHNHGTIIFDFRMGYTFKEKHKINIVIKNILNQEYMLRPGDVQPPVNYSALYTVTF